MLSLTKMARAAVIMERNPCQWLYSDMTDDGTGPDLLDRFLNLCWGCDEYLNDGLFQPDMDTVLRRHGRNDFRLVPSQAAVVGLLTAWNETRKVLVADQTFNELMNDAERAEGVTERFQSMRAALIWFRQGLERDVRTAELRVWLDAVGWPTILILAEKRDHAARELIAGRAFSASEGTAIAVLPPDWRAHAAA